MISSRTRSAIFALLAWIVSSAVPAAAADNVVEQIRVSADGAGPSHLFWIGSLPNGAGERVGIVDPLFAAIRMFDVEPRSNLRPKLHDRLKPAGVCSLPVSFRPWRLHQLKDSVVIESMPSPGRALQNATAETLRDDQYVLVRERLLTDSKGEFAGAASTISDAAWDPTKAPACGSLTRTSVVLGSGMPEQAERGRNNPRRTIHLWNSAGALAPTDRLIVRSPNGQAFALLSARELEPTKSTRIVQTTEGIDADDGIFRVTQRLVSYSRVSGRALATLTFNDRFVRSKIGLRPVTVLPDGEVLAMGKYISEDASAFRIISCGVLGETAFAQGDLCVADEGAVEAISTPDLKAVDVPVTEDDGIAGSSGPKTGLTARTIFENVRPLIDFRMTVDASRMPDECRDPGGCFTGQTDSNGKKLNFVPIRGIRLTRGFFERSGVPYAQANLPADLDGIMSSTFEQRSQTLADVMTARSGIPGNLMDHFEHDAGIDCSGLVQVAFGARSRRPHREPSSNELVDDRLSTASIQNFEDGLLCTSRLPNFGYLRPGDAINLNVAHTTNHVMLYAATIRVDKANDTWLMLESASGCDGVCWSLYDPSFFNGWGLYRAAGRSDERCPGKRARTETVIPTDFNSWAAMVQNVPSPIRRSSGVRIR